MVIEMPSCEYCVKIVADSLLPFDHIDFSNIAVSRDGSVVYITYVIRASFPLKLR